MSPKRSKENLILIRIELIKVSVFRCVVHTDIKGDIYRSRIEIKTARSMAKHSTANNIDIQAQPLVLN